MRQRNLNPRIDKTPPPASPGEVYSRNAVGVSKQLRARRDLHVTRAYARKSISRTRVPAHGKSLDNIVRSDTGLIIKPLQAPFQASF